jgi:hypothetical protein
MPFIIEMRMYFIFVILLTSCSSMNSRNSSLKSSLQNIDPEIRPYVVDFTQGLKDNGQEHDFDRALSHLRIKLVPKIRSFAGGFDNYAMGRCFLAEDLIEFDQAFWRQMPESQKQIAMDHELGHCLLKRTHRKIYDKNKQRAISVMSPTDRNFDYDKEKTELRRELFDKNFYGGFIILIDMTENQSEVFNKAFAFSTNRIEFELNGDLPMSKETQSFINYYQGRLNELIYK